MVKREIKIYKTPEEIEKFHKCFYRPLKTVLVVIREGNLSREKQSIITDQEK